MVEAFYAKENKPFPNNEWPVLHYPGAVLHLLREPNPAQAVLKLFEQNGYTNGWVNGIHPFHHFHSNSHEVLGCVSGEARVQLGGPGAEVYTFSKGDVLLLPAGTAHKRLDATDDFQIVGAYPGGQDFDMQKGEAADYEKMKENVKATAVPHSDPVEGENGAVKKYWEVE